MTTSHALSPELMLSVRGLSVSFRQHQQVVQAVNNLSFEVKKGETLAIVGESGSGKSVTSLALMRLIEQSGGQIDQGEIWLRRRDNSLVNMTETPSSVLRRIRGADIAMIFQEPMTSLNPVFPVGEQIAESIRLHQGKNHQQARSEALRMLDLVRMPDATGVFSRYPHQLSGGQRQRIMIAMAISCRPGMLIADEPTTALDVTVQAQILQLIRELQQELQMGVLFITHDMGVVAEIADRILVMRQGEQVESEAAETLFSHPQQPYTRALLAAIPRLGAMRGEPFPRYFPLPGEAEQRDTLQNTVQSDAEPLLTVRGLVTRFDLRGGILNRVQRRVHAVESISFDLRAGETLALVGESGCGKSTTARALLRLVQSQQGEIHFDGQRIDTLTAAQFAPLRRDIQLVFQDPYASLDPRLTVGFSIMEPLLIHGVAKGKIAEKRVAELLERVGLQPEHASRYPHEFSGGQRQRICIARALALQPKMIIADESVSALDVSVQAQIINLLLDLQRETGIAFLFISHDMAVVERVSHRVAVMYLGQIVEIGSRQAVFENPQHPYTRQLISAVPIADPARRWQKKNVITADIPSPVRAVGDEPGLVQLVEIEQGHYVARHATG